MKLIGFVVALLGVLEPYAAASEKGLKKKINEKIGNMNNFYWRPNENEPKVLCGMCRDKTDQDKNAKCNYKTGICPDIANGQRCMKGWDSSDPQCITPICENVNCGSDGVCIAPEQCVCTALSASDGSGGCYHLRVRGLIGAGAALVVLIISISVCAIIQTATSKKNN